MLCTGKQPNIIVSQFMHNHEIHLGILSPLLVLTKTNFKKNRYYLSTNAFSTIDWS